MKKKTKIEIRTPSMGEQLRALTDNAPLVAIEEANKAWPELEDEIHKAALEGRSQLTLVASEYDLAGRAKSAAIAAIAECSGLTVSRRRTENNMIHWRLSW